MLQCSRQLLINHHRKTRTMYSLHSNYTLATRHSITSLVLPWYITIVASTSSSLHTVVNTVASSRHAPHNRKEGGCRIGTSSVHTNTIPRNNRQ
jgi:hypothetical protein